MFSKGIELKAFQHECKSITYATYFGVFLNYQTRQTPTALLLRK